MRLATYTLAHAPLSTAYQWSLPMPMLPAVVAPQVMGVESLSQLRHCWQLLQYCAQGKR